MKFDAVTGNGRFDFLKAEVLLLALVSLLLGLPMHLSAQDTPEPLVVPFASIPPFGLRDHNGDRSGFIVDLAEMIGSEIGVPIDFVDVVDSTQFVAAQASGQSNFLPGILPLSELVETNVFSDQVAIDELPVVQRLAKEAELDGRIAFFGAPLASATRHVALHENRASLLGPINAAIATLEADGRLEQLRVRYNLALPPAAPDVLSVGVTDFPPYNIIGEDGSFSGFAVESLRALADRAGLAIDFQPITNEEFAAGPSLTTYDMLPQAGVTEARSQIMDFTLPLEQFDFTIFTLTNEAEGLTDLDSLGSRKVGVEAVNSARPIAERHGGLNLSVYYGRDSLLKALLNGEVEAILFPAVPMKEEIREQGAIGLVKAVTPPFRVIERAPALRHGLGTVRDALNVVIPGYLISDDYAALRQEYFGEPIFWTSTRIYGAGGTIGACMLLLSGYLFVHRQRRRAREFAMQQQSLAQEKAHSEKLALLVTDLEHSNRELDEFAYIASHDLKEPLRGIGINANFLLREKLPDAARVRALRMIELTTRMEQLISDLLFFSRIGRDVTSRVAVQPGQLIAAIRSDLSEWLAERGGEIVEIGQIPTLQASSTRGNQGERSTECDFCARQRHRDRRKEPRQSIPDFQSAKQTRRLSV